MKVDPHENVDQNSWFRTAGAFAIALMALGMASAAAQSDRAGAADGSSREPGQPGAIVADEEVTVFGQRSLRDFRIELQMAQERIYGLFNSLNSDDMFDIQCRNVPRTGTRIPQRVCEPQFAADSTHDAGNEFAIMIQRCGLTEACLESGNSRAQAILSEVPVRDKQLEDEVQRLAQEYPEFRQAIIGYETVARRYQDARRAEGLGLRASVQIIDTAGAAISSSRPERQSEVIRPAPINIEIPEASWVRLGRDDDREGWLKLRYSVLQDGTIADVRVVDALLPGLDVLSVIAAVQSWTFEPATEHGRPIDWHNNLAIVVFNRQQTANAGWPAFAEAYEQAAALAASAQYDEAKSRNEQMQEALAVTLEEMAFTQMQLAAIEHALGNTDAALDAIQRATEPAVEQLANEELLLALEHRFSLEMELGHAADALKTYERRMALERLPARNPMARLGGALDDFFEAPDNNLAALGTIGTAGNWQHQLTWPVFAVGDVDGAVERLDVLCNRGKAAVPLDEDVQIAIPSGWGECVLFALGQPGTTFVAYEFQELVD